MNKEVEKRRRGMPHAFYLYVLNTLIYILITLLPLVDIPSGEIWTSKSSTH